MGHKDGTKNAVMTTESALATLQEGDAIDARELAQKHTKDSIGLLARVVKRRQPKEDRPAWNTSVSAAKTLLEIGHGRAAQQETVKKDSGLTIVINQLTSEDQLERVVSGVQIAKEVAAHTVYGDEDEMEAALAELQESKD